MWISVSVIFCGLNTAVSFFSSAPGIPGGFLKTFISYIVSGSLSRWTFDPQLSDTLKCLAELPSTVHHHKNYSAPAFLFLTFFFFFFETIIYSGSLPLCNFETCSEGPLNDLGEFTTLLWPIYYSPVNHTGVTVI